MLSEHFSLEEMTRSGEALRRKIDNEPAAGQVENLRQLCLNVLEPVRRRFGATRITSGYRCPELNEAVGGVADSQHTRAKPPTYIYLTWRWAARCSTSYAGTPTSTSCSSSGV